MKKLVVILLCMVLLSTTFMACATPKIEKVTQPKQTTQPEQEQEPVEEPEYLDAINFYIDVSSLIIDIDGSIMLTSIDVNAKSKHRRVRK